MGSRHRNYEEPSRSSKGIGVTATKSSNPFHSPSSPLLRLPRELRDQVYTCVVTHDAPLLLPNVRPPALALTNRQLFSEVTAAFFEHNTFAVNVLLDWSKLDERAERFAVMACSPVRLWSPIRKLRYDGSDPVQVELKRRKLKELEDRAMRSFSVDANVRFSGGQEWLKLVGGALEFKAVTFNVYTLSMDRLAGCILVELGKSGLAVEVNGGKLAQYCSRRDDDLDLLKKISLLCDMLLRNVRARKYSRFTIDDLRAMVAISM
jgi:hypothetical protein